MLKTYAVTGMIKKGYARAMRIIVDAENAKEAKALALAAWENCHGDGHLFWLKATRTNASLTLANSMWHKTGEVVNGHWVDYV